MELKLNLGLETLINLIVFVQNLELESVALIAVAVLMTPVIFFSLWSLAFSVLYQLFWLGVKAGVLLGWVCSTYLIYLMGSAKWYPKDVAAPAAGVKCSYMDVVLSILFQAGVKFPAVIWDGLVTTVVPSSTEEENVNKKRKNVTFCDVVTSKPVSPTTTPNTENAEGMKVDEDETVLVAGDDPEEDPFMFNDEDFQSLINGMKIKVENVGEEALVRATPTCSTSAVASRSSSRRQSRASKRSSKNK